VRRFFVEERRHSEKGISGRPRKQGDELKVFTLVLLYPDFIRLSPDYFPSVPFRLSQGPALKSRNKSKTVVISPL